MNPYQVQTQFGPPPSRGGAFGADGPLGVFGPMIMPMLGQALTPGGTQFQFSPTGNAYDQLAAQRAFQNQTMAAQMSASQDRQRMEATLRGAYTMMQGRQLTQNEMGHVREASSTLASMTGFAAQIPGMSYYIDELMGPTGSSALFGAGVNRMGMTMVDPVTGRAGMSGRSSGIISNAMFQDMYGSGKTAGSLRGVKAGQMAEFAEQLQYNGLLGAQVGFMSQDAQASVLRNMQLSPDMARQLADESPAIKAIRQSGRQPTTQEMKTATDAVMSSAAQAQESGSISGVNGGGDLMRVAQAQRISAKLKDMAGSLSAMQEIFGSEGRPNAPMSEIFNRLNAITQGNMMSMDPTKLEQIVRKMQSLSQATGLSVEAMTATGAAMAGLSEQLNMPKSLVAGAVVDNAVFTSAARNAGNVATNLDVGLSLEELGAMDAQLLVRGAASNSGTQIATLRRMVHEGLIDPNEDSVEGRMAAAAMNGQTSFRGEDGRERSLLMSQAEFMETLGKTQDKDTINSMQNSTYTKSFADPKLSRKLMGQDFNRVMNPTVAAAINDQLGGLGLNAEEAGKAFLENAQANLTAEQINSPEYMQHMEAIMEKTLREQLRASGKTDQEIDQILTKKVLKNATIQAVDGMDTRIATTPGLQGFKSTRGVWQLTAQSSFDAAEKQDAQISQDAKLRSALGGLAKGGPLSRLSEALQNADENTSATDILRAFMGTTEAPSENAKNPHDAAAAGLLNTLLDAETNPENLPDGLSREAIMGAVTSGLEVLGGTGEQDISKLHEAVAAWEAQVDPQNNPEDYKRFLKFKQAANTASKVAAGELARPTYGDSIPKLPDAANSTPQDAASAVQAKAGKEGAAAAGAGSAGGETAQLGGATKLTGTIHITGLDRGSLVAELSSVDTNPEHSI